MNALRLALLSVFLTIPMGCGGVVNALLRTSETLSVGTSTGYRMLRAYDATKQDEIRNLASVDAARAQAEKDAYVPKQQLGLKVLDSASVGVESAHAAIPAIGQVIDKKKRAELAAWIPTLIKLGADVAQALAALGIKVPALGGAP